MAPPQRLHLDLAAGARADMICAALLAAGAPREAAREAFAAAGLERVHIDVEGARRGGLTCVRVRLRVDGDELCEPPQAPAVRTRMRHAVARPRLHPSSRGSAQPAATAAAVEGGANVDAPSFADVGAGRAERGGRSRAPDGGRGGGRDDGRGGGRGDGAARLRRRRQPGRVEAWLAGADATLGDVVDELKRAADLAPVPKALALKAARRCADALALVAGTARLRGPHAVRLLADVVMGAALVDALSPAAVTASPVCISPTPDDEGVVGVTGWPAPSPWLLEVLAGVPVIERDDVPACTDVAGAALAWACVHRFGARGLSSSTKQGLGAGAPDVPGLAVVARALLGPPQPVRTRAGERALEPALALDARLPAGVDRAALAAALPALGAREMWALDAAGGVALRVLAPPAAADDVTRALWEAGAVDVSAAWIELRTAGVLDVTVPIGRGRTKAGVKVRVWKDGGAVLRVEPDLDDARAAAKRQRTSVHAVAAEAVAAWERLFGDDDEG